MTTPHWHFIPVDEVAVQHLHDTLTLDPLFCRLLVQRGITTETEARTYFRPKLENLHDPFLMRDMHTAVERLDRALKHNENILLYGDYDVDGTTCVALMYAFLSSFTRQLDYYIPDRDKEGYGVSIAGVEYARETGCTLVVAMDCGIKAHEAIALARTYGIDFIVCDHHVPEGDLPVAVANLDPKRPDCAYPYKDLSGCGIAFKLAQAYMLHNNDQTPPEALESLLDLVAVSIACDIVPMTGENRIMAHFGLQRINNTPRLGIWALINRCKRNFPVDVQDLVFGIGPLINSAGRLGDAREAVRLLLSADRNSALENAGHLADRNRVRREVDYSMADAARQYFMETPNWEQRHSIVLYDPGWHKGVIGIAASRMAESFHRPAVIITQSNERAVGSARSIPGFDLYEALQRCEDLFFSYGGHAHAAGMQMPPENVQAFAEKFENIVREKMSDGAAIPTLDICAELHFNQITPDFWKILKKMAPFGPHNHNPVFRAKGVYDTGNSRLLANNHVRFSLRQGDHKPTFSGIGFGLGEAFQQLPPNQPFDIAFSIRRDNWRGQPYLSLQVKALAPHIPGD